MPQVETVTIGSDEANPRAFKRSAGQFLALLLSRRNRPARAGRCDVRHSATAQFNDDQFLVSDGAGYERDRCLDR